MTAMSKKRKDLSCPSCGERLRKKALRCPACGTTNPLQERKQFGEGLGLGWVLFLLAVAGIVLVLLSVWLARELFTVGRLDPYLASAVGLLLLVGAGSAVARRWWKRQ